MKIRKLFKSKFYIAMLIAFIFGCNDTNNSFNEILKSNDLQKIELKRKEIIVNQQKIFDQLNLIDNKIEELNGTNNYPVVKTIFLKKEKFDHYVDLQGSIVSDQLINLVPEFSGILKKIYVESGDNVVKGQKLAEIDDGGLKDQLSQLEITFQLTETTYLRQEKLWSEKIGSEIEYLQTKALYETQKKGIEQLKKQLQKTSITAPFNGIIDKVHSKEGEVVFPGQSKIMLILNMDNMYVESNVPENYLNSIYKGKNAIIEFPYEGGKLESEIRQSGNFINPNNRTFKIEINLPKNKLNIKPNLNVRIKVNDYTNENAILIDESFVSIDSNNEKYVYKVINDRGQSIVIKNIIDTGKSDGNRIEVVSGLNENDEIVSQGIRKIVDNARVIVKK